MLSADKEVMSDFRQRSPKSPNVERLPVVIWSRLYYDTAPYLNERSADGTSLLAFFHRQLRDVVTEEYLTGEMAREHHRALAVYFAERPHQIERDGCQTLNFRKLSELPYQQREGEMWSELEYTLCDLSFIEAKCTAGMVYDLIADYNAALVAQDMPPDTQRRIAEFAHFLETQSHVLARCPALTFQQALNEPDATAPAQAAHQRVQTGQETRPHMRWLNKPQLVSRRLMTIVGHSDIINSCAISPDGTRIVSASSDRTLKIWDMADGKELLTLRGHIDSVETCAFAPDGSHIVSGARDGEVKIWDAVSGQEVARLAGHKDAPVASCTFAPSGKQVVSASWDHTLKVWEASTGEELYTIHGHDSPVFTCAFSPDGSRIVSGADDGSLKLWDTHNGTELEPLAGHAKGVMACAFSADGTWIVSASEDGTLRR